MIEQQILEEKLNRLSIALVEKYNISPDAAVEKLKSFNLTLICGDEIANSVALQSALVTSINTGRRAFLGGVFVKMNPNVLSLLPWPTNSLNEIVKDLGAIEWNEKLPSTSFTLTFGIKAENYDTLEVVCNGWQGGVKAFNDDFDLINDNDFCLGGVLGGGIGVGLAFLKVAGLDKFASDKSVGLSLWRPDLNWLDNLSYGPQLLYLPKKIWLLALGHLGQANVWTIGLLPFQNSKDVTIYLQDFDSIVEANKSAGLLSYDTNIGQKKTRVCSDWLEGRGFKTAIIERAFDDNTIRNSDEEPEILIAGLDSEVSRRSLQMNRFCCIIDSGLGGTLSNFDSITIHNFPAYKKNPKEIWDATPKNKIEHANLKSQLDEMNACGVLAEKAISSSFVGVISSTITLSEILRGYNNGIKIEKLSVSVRNLSECKVIAAGNFTTELFANKYVNVA